MSVNGITGVLPCIRKFEMLSFTSGSCIVPKFLWSKRLNYWTKCVKLPCEASTVCIQEFPSNKKSGSWAQKTPLIRIFLFSETHTFVIENCGKYVQLNIFVIFVFQCRNSYICYRKFWKICTTKYFRYLFFQCDDLMF